MDEETDFVWLYTCHLSAEVLEQKVLKTSIRLILMASSF